MSTLDAERFRARLARLYDEASATRYAARIELSGRDTDDVVLHARKWVSELDRDDQLGPARGRRHDGHGEQGCRRRELQDGS